MQKRASERATAMESPHALVIPFPAQGHVIPFMELSHRLIDLGFRITFVNTQFNHARLMATLSNAGGIQSLQSKLRMAAIPDGMQPGEDRNKLGKFIDCFLRDMAGGLEKLISDINELDSDKITCVIADGVMAWALKVAAKMGIQAVAFWTGAVEFWRLNFQIPKLIEDGIIDTNESDPKNSKLRWHDRIHKRRTRIRNRNDSVELIGFAGFPTKEQMIRLSPAFPAMPATELPWLSVGDRITQQSVFRLYSECGLTLEFADRLLCNSCCEIDPAAFELAPKVQTIGPLLAGSRLRRFEGNFWQEDSTCLRWLDERPPNSVIYVAFGSFTIFDRRQFQDLALGLELCNRSFLWVVRPDMTEASTDAFPDGFKTRVANRGQIVGWSPQQKVLAHPSIACFVTHCGWNSTTEGLSNGIPFLGWPYFGDRQLNLTYICDVWNVGLAIEKDSDGIVSREEIKEKIEALLGDESIKARSLELKAIVRKSVAEGGSSFKNLNNFVETMKSEKGISNGGNDD